MNEITPLIINNIFIGIANVQEYYNLNITELANGFICDPFTGKQFQAEKMSIPEMILVGETLLEDEIYDNLVEWLEVAFVLIQQREGYTKTDIQYIESLLQYAKVLRNKNGLYFPCVSSSFIYEYS